MFDLKVLHLKDFAAITKAEFLSQSEVETHFPLVYGSRLPSVIRLEGKNFHTTTDVLINGFRVQYTAVSASLILAILPRDLESAPIKSIYVINDRSDFTNYSMFSYEVGSNFSAVTGVNKAVSQYIKVLLQTPGSCSFEPNLGGSLQKIPGSNFKAPYSVLAKVALALTNTAEVIRQQQANLQMPADEKLQSVDILFLDFADGDPSSVEAKIKFNTLGQSNIPVSVTLGVQGLLENI